MISAYLNDTGLVVDIIGAVLLFKFGLPDSINRKGHIYLITEQNNPEEERKCQQYDRFGKLGLIFIIIGFLLQVISNHSSN